MKARTLVFATSLVLSACATREAPVPQPAPAPRVATPQPAARPEAKPEAPKAPSLVNFSSTELFEFNKAALTPHAREVLEREVVAKLNDLGTVRYVNVNGHADRLGSAQYNQKLSEQRAEAVRSYLLSKGVPADKVETFGFGKTSPIKSCPEQKNRKALIECLAPNRRVVVEIQGTPR